MRQVERPRPKRYTCIKIKCPSCYHNKAFLKINKDKIDTFIKKCSKCGHINNGTLTYLNKHKVKRIKVI